MKAELCVNQFVVAIIGTLSLASSVYEEISLVSGEGRQSYHGDIGGTSPNLEGVDERSTALMQAGIFKTRSVVQIAENDAATTNASFSTLSGERGRNSAAAGASLNASAQYPLLSFPDQHFSVYPDPVKQRTHFFVVGPETSGTRLISKIIAQDVSIPSAFGWDAHTWIADPQDAIFHVSFPWGHLCPPAGGSVPTLSTWGGTYSRSDPSRVSGPVGNPTRFNVDIPKLLQDYANRAEQVEVLMVVRDPEVSIRGKMKGHCPRGREIALEEQNKAYQLLLAAKSLPHVHTVCYEDLVANQQAVLQNMRQVLNIPARSHISVYDGNAKYHLDATKYPCTDSLRAYRQLCPNSHVARANAACF